MFRVQRLKARCQGWVSKLRTLFALFGDGSCHKLRMNKIDLFVTSRNQYDPRSEITSVSKSKFISLLTSFDV